MTTLISRTVSLESRVVSSKYRSHDRRPLWICTRCQARSLSTTDQPLRKRIRYSRLATPSIQTNLSASKRTSLHAPKPGARSHSQYSAANGVTLEELDPWGRPWGSRQVEEAEVDAKVEDGDRGYGVTAEDTEMDNASSRASNNIQASYLANERAAIASGGFFTGDALDVLEKERLANEAAKLTSAEERARSHILQAANGEHSDRLIKSLSAARDLPRVLGSMSAGEFSNILGVLCSDANVEQIIKKHSTISNDHTGLMRVASLQKLMNEFVKTVTDIARDRRQAGIKLQTEDFQRLLLACHTTGNNKVAQIIWQWMANDEARPDTACYNNYLGAFVWNDLLPEYRAKQRMTSFNYTARDNPFSGKPFDNYRVGDGGIKQLTSSVFGGMLQMGVDADEETICHVLVGLAREKDLKGMRKLLNRIWGIDVRRIMDEDDSPPQKSTAAGSPLYPSSRLLGTLSFCYSINDDVPTGLRVVDYTSRHFGVAAGPDVWESLLHWAYVLSRPVGQKHPDPSPLDPSAILGVWNTMQLEPYNITPSMSMFNYVIRAHWTSGNGMELYNAMNQAMDIFWEEVNVYKAAWAKLYDALDATSDPEGVEAAQKTVDQIGLSVKRNSQFLKSWAKLMLTVSRDDVAFAGAEQIGWELIPSLFHGRWRHFLPQTVTYFTRTGHVQITKMSDGEILQEHRSKQRIAIRQKRVFDESPRALGHDWVHQVYDNKRLSGDRMWDDELLALSMPSPSRG